MTPQDMRDYWFEIKVAELQRIFSQTDPAKVRKDVAMLDEFNRVLSEYFNSFKPQG